MSKLGSDLLFSKEMYENMAIKKYNKNKKLNNNGSTVIATIALAGAFMTMGISAFAFSSNTNYTCERAEVVEFETLTVNSETESKREVTVEKNKEKATKAELTELVNYYTGSEYVSLESEKNLISVYDKAIVVNDNAKTGFEEPSTIRCTFYTDHGYTKSGTYTRPGVLAGKKEWLGKTCMLYSINEDGSIGDLIGTYEFLDTGAGINGTSLKDGESIDMWFSNYSEGDSFRDTYGDYVYMQMIEAQG